MSVMRKRLKVLHRYLKSKGTKEETIVDNWYHSIDDSQPIPLWQEEGKKAAVRNSICQYVFDHIKTATLQQVQQMPSAASRWRMAAVVAGLLLGTYILYYFLQPGISYTTVSVPLGKVKKVQLPDNSIVWLKSGSTLRFSSEFNKVSREVELPDGEAFFEVQRHAAKPFIVTTDSVQTTVLGTAFIIQHYKNRPETQVWVEHGLVEVSQSQKVLQRLSKHQRIQLNRGTGNFTTDSLQWQQAMAWQKGVLLLKSASFDELAAALSDFYGVQLVSTNPAIRALHFDAKFFINTPLDQILPLITELHHIRYSKKNNQIIFH